MNSIADGTIPLSVMSRLPHQLALHGSPILASQPQDLQGRLLNQAGFGVCVIDAGLQLVYTNLIAEQLFCDRYYPSRSRFVAGDDAVESRRVRAALLDALAGQAQLIEIDLASARLMAAFSPIQLAQGQYGAAVTMERTESVPGPVLQAYARLIRLTRRETAVAASLARGLDPTDAANELGIAVETVRTHIRAILMKARAGNMRELLVRISRLPPMMPAMQPAKSRSMAVPASARTAMVPSGAPARDAAKTNASASASRATFCSGLENLARGHLR